MTAHLGHETRPGQSADRTQGPDPLRRLERSVHRATYARADYAGHPRALREMYDVEVCPDLVSRVPDAVVGELRGWHGRPLHRVYPVMFIDALMVKIRDGVVANAGLSGQRHRLRRRQTGLGRVARTGSSPASSTRARAAGWARALRPRVPLRVPRQARRPNAPRCASGRHPRALGGLAGDVQQARRRARRARRRDAPKVRSLKRNRTRPHPTAAAPAAASLRWLTPWRVLIRPAGP